jgi:hypothetical protein
LEWLKFFKKNKPNFSNNYKFNKFQLFGEKIPAFEWMSTGCNSMKFLNISVFVHALIMLIPTVALHLYKLDLSGVPELCQLTIEHPSVMLMHRQNSKILVGLCLICLVSIVTELLCCLVANIGIFRGKFGD